MILSRAARRRRVLPAVVLSAAAVLLGGPVPSGGRQTVSADPNLKWEVEFHGGLMGAFLPTGGRSVRLAPGRPFTTEVGEPSRYVSSWYVGDGAALLNEVSGAFGFSERIVALDPAVEGPAVEGATRGTFGVRLTRVITPRISVEVSLDYGRANLEMTPQTAAAVEVSRQTFAETMRAVIPTSQFSDVSVSSVGFLVDPPSQLFTTGALRLALRDEGRLIPYVTAGAGVVHRIGDAAGAVLEGEYRFIGFADSQFHELDRLRLEVSEPRFVAFVGGGARYWIGPRWGLRGDARAYLGGGPDNRLDLNPHVVTIGPFGYWNASHTTPSIQFANVTPNDSSDIRSSLSGPRIRDFRSFDAGGRSTRIQLSLGVFWQF